MTRINIRALDEITHERLTASAAKNQRSLEAEIRYALNEYTERLHAGTEPQTARQRWQVEAGTRLETIANLLCKREKIDCASEDALIRMAQAIGEPTPARLLDCAEGLAPLQFEVAQALKKNFGCNPDWLITGSGHPFLVDQSKGETNA